MKAFWNQFHHQVIEGYVLKAFLTAFLSCFSTTCFLGLEDSPFKKHITFKILGAKNRRKNLHKHYGPTFQIRRFEYWLLSWFHIDIRDVNFFLNLRGLAVVWVVWVIRPCCLNKDLPNSVWKYFLDLNL